MNGSDWYSQSDDTKTSTCKNCADAVRPTDVYCLRCGALLDPAPDNHRLWKCGHLLVAERDAAFPDRCLRTNRPSTQFVIHQFNWISPWVLILGLAICGVPIIGVMISMVLLGFNSKRAAFWLPFSDEAIREKQRRILTMMTATAALFLNLPVAFLLSNTAFSIIFLFGLVIIAGLVYVTVPLVSVSKIERNYVFIKGVCPEFLSLLPEFRSHQ